MVRQPLSQDRVKTKVNKISRWPNDLINFPTSVQEDLGRFLFSSDGLHLSSYRYNMGADGGNDTRVVNNAGRTVQSFLLRNGTYDFSRDRAGVTFMKMAAQYNVPEITFFVNAAPSNISTNGAACGWDMPREKVPEFVNYIVKVLSYWTGQGIPIQWISPMNEPDVSRSDCGQEGMFVGITKRPYVFSTLRAALDNSSVSNPATAVRNISIMGDETSQVTTETFLEYPLWLPAAKNSLNGISVHNYDFPDDLSLGVYRTLLNLEVGPNGPPVKFTETCCSTRFGSGIPIFGSQYDPTMQNALIVARYVWQFLTIVQATSFDWWLAVSFLPCSPTLDGPSCNPAALAPSSGFNDGLIYIDPRYPQSQDYTLHFTKRAYMLKHFAYFHRPGSVRYDVPQMQFPSQVNAVASLSADMSTWNVLFMNAMNATYDLQLQVPSASARVSRIVLTTNQDDWRDETNLPVVNGSTVAYTLPAMSLVTVQFTQ
jgi:hypothetical protein